MERCHRAEAMTVSREMMETDYFDRFGGVGRLLGKAGLARLQLAHVCVVGLGGVGSWAVEGLARSGIGRLTLVDLDDVCITNMNRQLPALDGALGRPKAAVLAERIHLINPHCRVEPRLEFFTPSSAEAILGPGFDFVIDAVDDVENKALLIAECVRRRLRCVTTGGVGGKRDGTQLRVADLGDAAGDDLLRLTRKTLRRQHGFTSGEGVNFGVRSVYSPEHPMYSWADGTCSKEREPGSKVRLACAGGFGTAVFVTAAFGFAAAGEAVRMIVEHGVRTPPSLASATGV